MAKYKLVFKDSNKIKRYNYDTDEYETYEGTILKTIKDRFKIIFFEKKDMPNTFCCYYNSEEGYKPYDFLEFEDTNVKHNITKNDIKWVRKELDEGESFNKESTAEEIAKTLEDLKDKGYKWVNYLDINVEDSKFKDKDPRPVSEIAKHLNVWIDAFLDNDDELSEEYEKPFRNIQKDKRLLNKVSNELKTQFDALDLDLNNLEDAPDISRIIWKEMKRFTRR